SARPTSSITALPSATRNSLPNPLCPLTPPGLGGVALACHLPAAAAGVLPLCSQPMDTSWARAVLARTPALQAGHLRELLAAAGEAERPVGARVTQRVRLPGPAQEFLAAPDGAAIDADLAWLAASGARIVLATDPDYPPLLLQIAGAPAALYVQGSVELLST